MSPSCCIKTCRKKNKDGVSLFRFPFKKEDIFKKWLQNIGDVNFKPRKCDFICSAHFQQKDFLSARDTGLLLNYSAVPSIFLSMPRNEESTLDVSSTFTSFVSDVSDTSTMERISIENMDVCDTMAQSNIKESISTMTKDMDVCDTETQSYIKKNSSIGEGMDICDTITQSNIKESTSTITEEMDVCDTVTEPNIKENTFTISEGIDLCNIIKPKQKKKFMDSLTVHFQKQELSPRKKKMQNEINALKAKLRRRDKKIRSLEGLCQTLRQKNLLENQECEVILKNFNGMIGELFKNEWQNRNKSRKGCRYTDEIKQFALTLHYYSPKAYNYCRSILHLPHISSMRNWLSSINVEPGFLDEVLKEISKFPLHVRNCNLVFDSMAIRKQVIWDKSKNKFVGTCDYGNNITMEDSETYATEVLVFMLVSLSGKYKWPIAYFFINKISATMQCELIKTALILCHQSGIKVWSVTCDGAHVNNATMNKLGCDLYVTEYSKLKTSFKHPSTHDDVYYVPDGCHLVKLARNALAELLIFKSPSGLIEWQHITDLHVLQNNINFKLANKLSNAHIHYKQNIMKVKLAVQTLSYSTATALEFLNFSQVNGFNDCNSTVEFIKIVDEIFDFLNSRNPFAKGSKKPIYIDNIVNLEEKMEKNINYLFSLKVHNQSDLLLCSSKRRTFIIGFAAAVKSILQIAKEILLDSSLKYLMTYRFSQDHLELFFAQIRRRNSWNNNPNVTQFTSAMKSLLVKNSISASENSNCVTFELENQVGFQLKWSKKNYTKKWHDDVQWDTLNNNTIDDDSDSDLQSLHIIFGNTFVTENILYYISGNIVRKLIKKIKCNGCIDNVIQKVSDRKNRIATYTILVDLKNKGGLIYASRDVYKIVCSIEKEFSFSVKNKQIQKRGTYNDIVTRITRKFVLNTNVFPLDNRCFDEIEVGEETPHRVQLPFVGNI